MITKILLNAILNHVIMSWIISLNKEMMYDIDKNNYQDWFKNCPWYNTFICSKLHGSIFEYFITHARTDRYNLMCSLVERDKMQPNYEDYERSIGDRSITKDATTKALKSLGATLKFIDIWLKLLRDNYDARCDEYFNAMKDMFNKIPQTMSQPLPLCEKVLRYYHH